jgi:SAM-dependent methyltransferase
MVTGKQLPPPGLDVTTPNVARMYDYYLGGKDNFEADRSAAEKVLTLVPGLRRAVLENRRFLRRVVRYLAAEAGVSQFLDIGVGLPTQGAVHEVAHEVSPGARVVYADYDPVVVTHGQALLTVDDRSVMVRGDLRRPAELLARPEVRAHLDFTKPVAMMLFAVLHFVPDADDPARIVACLRDAVAPGSYLAISHIGTEFFPDKQALTRAVAVYEKASERVWPRSRDQILGFLDGFELLEPGLVPKHQWRPVTGEAASGTPTIQWGAVGRKP